jgi:hypothetical protein
MSDKEAWFLAVVRDLYKLCVRNQGRVSAFRLEYWKRNAYNPGIKDYEFSPRRKEPFLISIDG